MKIIEKYYYSRHVHNEFVFVFNFLLKMHLVTRTVQKLRKLVSS